MLFASFSLGAATGINPLLVMGGLTLVQYSAKNLFGGFAFSSFGSLTASGDTIINLPFVPQYLLIGTVDTPLTITKLSVSIEGNEQTNISGLALIKAFSQWMMEGMLGADVKVGQIIKIADGKILGKDCQIQVTNGSATTPTYYAFGDRNGSTGIKAGMSTIQASSNKLYNAFGALMFASTNIEYAQITWNNGYTDKLTIPEMRALFVMNNVSDADGELSAITVIDNLNSTDDARGQIASVDLYNGSGGTTTVVIVR